MSDQTPQSRHDDDAHADALPPTDAVTDEVRQDAASAQGLSAEDRTRLAAGENDELPPPPPTDADDSDDPEERFGTPGE